MNSNTYNVCYSHYNCTLTQPEDCQKSARSGAYASRDVSPIVQMGNVAANIIPGIRFLDVYLNFE